MNGFDYGWEDNGTSSNNVWKTAAETYAAVQATKSAERVELAKANLAAEVAKTSRTQASPSGFLSGYQMTNPLPGMWSPFPQAQTKPAPGGQAVAFEFNPMLLLILAGIALFVLLGFGRKR